MTKLVAIAGMTLMLASAAAGAAANGKAAAKRQGASEPKYCIAFEPGTGSHIAKTECRTKSEWRDLGIDVDELIHK